MKREPTVNISLPLDSVNISALSVVAAESGELLYWDIRTKKVIFKDRQEDIQQIFFYKNQTRCVVVSKQGTRGNKEFLLLIS